MESCNLLSRNIEKGDFFLTAKYKSMAANNKNQNLLENENNGLVVSYSEIEKPKENTYKNAIKLSPDEIDCVAREIYYYLLEKKLWKNVSLFFNQICWSTQSRNKRENKENDVPFVFPDEPYRTIYCVRSPNILTMQFWENSLVEMLNNETQTKAEISKILKKYGLALVLGSSSFLNASTDFTCHQF